MMNNLTTQYVDARHKAIKRKTNRNENIKITDLTYDFDQPETSMINFHDQMINEINNVNNQINNIQKYLYDNMHINTSVKNKYVKNFLNEINNTINTLGKKISVYDSVRLGLANQYENNVVSHLKDKILQTTSLYYDMLQKYKVDENNCFKNLESIMGHNVMIDTSVNNSKTAYNYIIDRHKRILQISDEIDEVFTLFNIMRQLLNVQTKKINQIQSNVQSTKDNISDANTTLKINQKKKSEHRCVCL